MRLLYFLALQCLCVSLHAQPETTVTPFIIIPPVTIPPNPQPANITDPNVTAAADFALQYINDRRPFRAGKLVLVQIDSAEIQVVSGIVYTLQIEVTVTNPDNRSSKADAESSVTVDSDYKVCTVQVWEKEWLNKKELTYQNCSSLPERRRRAVPGGVADADVNEEGVKRAANFALVAVDKRSNSAYKQTLVQILSAKKQVVAGKLYHLQLEVGESSCDKGSSKADSECRLREGSNNQVCKVKVLDRPWLNKWEVTQLHCSAKTERKR